MNKLIQYSVMVAVGVLIFSAFLIPIVNDATVGEKTANNTGVSFVELSENETLNVKYENKILTVNDEVITPYPIYSWVFSEDFALRCTSGAAGGKWFIITPTINTELTDLVMTFNNGAYSGTYNGTNAVSGTYEKVFYKSAEKAPYVMTGEGVIYVNENSPINCYGVTGSTRVHITGTLDDITITVGGNTVNAEDINVNMTQVKPGVDLYKFTSVTFSYNGTDYTYDRVVLPASVDYTDPAAEGSTAAIINIIPLIVIVGLIAGIVGVVAIRRNA